ncbi:MAG: alpha/beta hydrolase [Flavobacteriales bacterium]|jgi:predicted alpha/beta hydrolase|nr:alpha/beta hydrolase [Flavobacteriales bacterium]
MDIQHEKYFLKITENDTICLHRFYTQKENNNPVFMLHGAMENSKIFHSKSQKGFAPFLAKNGYDVFAVDMRGKGESFPKVSKLNKQTQTDQILQDIPLCLSKITELTGKETFHFVGHSWGGVLLLSFLARFPDTKVKSAVFFGSKRRVSVFTLRRVFYIDLMWNVVGNLWGNLKGYVPFTKMKAGSDDEPLAFYREMNHWVYSRSWKDKNDAFDYKAQLHQIDLPPILYYTGIKDHTLGNQKDVRLLIKETGIRQASKFVLLSQSNNNLVDYDHINILTHPKAEKDHFIEALEWINDHS